MALAAQGLTVARIIYPMKVHAQLSEGGAGAIALASPKKRRAPPKGTRGLPRGPMPTPPLVRSTAFERWVPTEMVGAGIERVRNAVRDLRDPDVRFVMERRVVEPGWLIRWDEVSVSQNVLMRRYANKHAYGRLVQTWAKIFWTAMHAGGIPKAAGKRRLTITRYVRDERYRLDRGNVSGGFKPYLDAAVRAGLIMNDREQDVDDQYRQAIDPDERVEILVQDL